MEVLIDSENDKTAFIKKSLEDFEEHVLNDDYDIPVPLIFVVDNNTAAGIILYHAYNESWIFLTEGYFNWDYEDTSLYGLYLKLLNKSQTFKIVYENTRPI